MRQTTYRQRSVTAASILRLVERWADFGQVGYNAWCRVDGQVADANAAVKLAVHV